MKRLVLILYILTKLSAFGQSNTDWIPFRIKLVDNNDTILNGFDFYLTANRISYYPSLNDSLKCFEFLFVAGLVDFHLTYKNIKYKFTDIETYRLMYYEEWTVTLNNLATDTCYEIIAFHSGAGWEKVGPYPVPICENKNLIWTTSFYQPTKKMIKEARKQHRKYKRMQKFSLRRLAFNIQLAWIKLFY